MFTGIIEEKGKIKSKTHENIEIECKKVLEGTKIGDSIAVSGVCLTVTKLYANSFSADISPSTIKSTKFSVAKIGDFVNLERAMSATSRFGGHIVTGHVDFVSKVISENFDGNAYVYKLSLDKDYARYIVKKGSITVDGISLTVVETDKNSFTLYIIPHTKAEVAPIKTSANIECDILAKYLESMMNTKLKEEIDDGNKLYNKLVENGFF